MRVNEFDYDLPREQIAQEPPAEREEARLLTLGREDGATAHRGIRDLPDLLRSGDLLVANDTRVLPARLFARRETGGRVELLLLEPEPGDPGTWQALARSGGTLREGEVLELGDRAGLRLQADLGAGHWRVQGIEADLFDLMARHGRMPLPPYIRREASDARADLDRARYQTTFARHEGAVAAPTAGLHLTPALFRQLADAGVSTAFLTLHVGLGTFEPVRAERLEDHPMHEERYDIPVAAAEAVEATRTAGGRVIAVGTTCVRALEASALASRDGRVRVGADRTDLLIAPGFRFRVVDGLLTNFHLPRSTLLALVSAFAGRDAILAAYREAVAQDYRFYSYGDAMLIL